MSGTYEKVVDRPEPHECRPPGAFNRWWNRVGNGTIWRCKCGEGWLWDIHTPLWPYPGWRNINQLSDDERRAEYIHKKTGMSI